MVDKRFIYIYPVNQIYDQKTDRLYSFNNLEELTKLLNELNGE